MAHLLRTKIQLPPLRPRHIHRGRLLEQLETRPESGMVLVSAPAGFGKSSCLVEWAHQLRQQGVVVAWYALDEPDNDPAHFAAYLSAALRIVPADLPGLPAEDERLDLPELVNRIINTAVDFGGPVVLVLDDYHLIEEPRIHDVISRMSEYLPPNLRLAIGTRADPPLQLARLRAQGRITEIRMADLSFSSDELAEWLHVILGRAPSQQVLERLHTLTEGWAAALALIIMSQPKLDEAALEHQLMRFSQTQQHIFDYFAQEVFRQLPEPLQSFLLDTCVLNWLHPELCDAITGRGDSLRVLTQLASDSLFLIPLSDTEALYRYHHLFSHFLRQYLEMQDHTAYLAQHRKAAHLHNEMGRLVEAINHALAAEDAGYAARLIETRAWEQLTSRGEIITIINWLPRFSAENLQHFPRLCLYFSRALYLIGDTGGSADYLEMAINALEHADISAAERRDLQTIAANYQATLAAYRGDIEAGMHWIEQAVAHEQSVTPLDQVRIANTHAYLQYLCGDVPAARRAYNEALRRAESLNHQYLMLDAHFYLAQTDMLAGELEAVQERCEALLAQYSNRIAPLCTVMLPLAMVYYQRNRLVEAEALIREAIKLARSASIIDVLWFAHVLLANIQLSQGAAAEAATSIEQARSYARGYASPMMASYIGAAEARILLRSGLRQAAVDWAGSYQQSQAVGYHRDYEDVSLAQVMLVQDQPQQALALLDQIIARAEPAGRMSYVIHSELLRGLAWQALDDDNAALAAMRRALRLARPHGFVRAFLDTGPAMMRLLRSARSQHIEVDYAVLLLDQYDDGTRLHPADALTEREVEVLAQIAAGASNQEIAQALVISLGTVKSHIHHIMNKLDAQNRTEAVSIARNLNILAD